MRATTNADDGETAAIIMQLRQKLKAQTDEITSLQSKLTNVHSDHQKEVSHLTFWSYSCSGPSTAARYIS